MHIHGTSFADTDDGEEVVDTKVGCVHSTDSRLRPSKVYLQCMILASACWLNGEIINPERIDTRSWNKV